MCNLNYPVQKFLQINAGEIIKKEFYFNNDHEQIIDSIVVFINVLKTLF